jgi:YHS domain-containing protein
MITTLIATIAMGYVAPADALNCPVMGSPVPANAKGVDYAGVRYLMCCAGCDTTFAKDTAKYTKAKEGKTIGQSLFDPVSAVRVDVKKAKGPMDYKGIRYYFSSDDNAAAFKADMAKFTKAPEKEVLYCPVMKHGIENYDTAGSYTDFEGVRYYLCCGDCQAQMKKDPASFAKGVADKVAKPSVRTYKVK